VGNEGNNRMGGVGRMRTLRVDGWLHGDWGREGGVGDGSGKRETLMSR
jgi:hypothetical protein